METTIEDLQKLGVDIDFARRALQKSDAELLLLAENPLEFVRALTKAVWEAPEAADIIINTYKGLTQAQDDALVIHTSNGITIRPTQHDIDAEPDALRDFISWIKWWRTLTGECLVESRNASYARREYASLKDFIAARRR